MRKINTLYFIATTLLILQLIGSCTNSVKTTTQISVEVNTPDLLAQLALASESNLFREMQEEALNRFKDKESNFLELFIEVHKELHPDRALIKTFGTEATLEKLTLRATDSETEKYLEDKIAHFYQEIINTHKVRLNNLNILVGKVIPNPTINKIFYKVSDIAENQKESVEKSMSTNVSLRFIKALTLKEMTDFFVTFYEQKIVPKVDDSSSKDTSNVKMSLMDELLAEEQRNEKIDSIKANTLKLKPNLEAMETQRINTPLLGFGAISEMSRIMDSLNSHKEELKQDDFNFYWGAEPISLGEDSEPARVLYALKNVAKKGANLNSNHIISAKIKVDENTGQLQINTTFNEEGKVLLEKITSAHYNEFMAIVVNEKVISCPIINSPITGGELVISGGLKKPEAQFLSNQLNAGSLPASCRVVSIKKDQQE